MNLHSRSVVVSVMLLFAGLLVAQRRHQITEAVKDMSDDVVAGFLRSTSQFGFELTEERWAEQDAFREQRMRDLRDRRARRM